MCVVCVCVCVCVCARTCVRNENMETKRHGRLAWLAISYLRTATASGARLRKHGIVKATQQCLVTNTPTMDRKYVQATPTILNIHKLCAVIS